MLYLVLSTRRRPLYGRTLAKLHLKLCKTHSSHSIGVLVVTCEVEVLGPRQLGLGAGVVLQQVDVEAGGGADD